jgi:hypothetical protein
MLSRRLAMLPHTEDSRFFHPTASVRERVLSERTCPSLSALPEVPEHAFDGDRIGWHQDFLVIAGLGGTASDVGAVTGDSLQHDRFRAALDGAVGARG